MTLCDYSNVFGLPGQGAHSIRIMDVAVVDLGMTVLVAYLIYQYHAKYNFLVYLMILLLIGIIMHRLFCVRTTFDKIIFGQDA